MHAKSTVKPIKDGMKGVILPSSGDDQGARKENPVRKIPDFLSSLLLSSQVSKSISVFGRKFMFDKLWGKAYKMDPC